MNDAVLMQRCFELALRGLGKVSPNPLVGAVIVKDGEIIGEGYHTAFGNAHAEVEAVNSVSNHDLLKGAMIYVNLEPCCHHGKTPPCTNLIIDKGFKEVIISNKDPFPEVSGKGIAMLNDAGIEVRTGLLENQGLELNRRFFTFQERQRPYVILKWAESANGFMDIDRSNGEKGSFWLTSYPSKQLSHKWRTEEDAILVGGKTVINDDPSLTAREWHGRNPLRIVVDTQGTLSSKYKVFNDKAQTFLASTNEAVKPDILLNEGAWVEGLLSELMVKQIQSVIVEGGQATLQAFINTGNYDEIRRFASTKHIEGGLPAPNNWNGTLTDTVDSGTDQLYIYRT